MLLTGVHVCRLPGPTDMSGLLDLLDVDRLLPSSIVAIVGKTEGTGAAVDFGREMTESHILRVLSDRMGCSKDEVEDQVSIICSGGCFGVTEPHLTIFTRQLVEEDGAGGEPGPDGRLVVGRSRSQPVLPHEVGRTAHAVKVARAVEEAVKDSSITDPSDVHAVLVKGPALSRADLRDIVQSGHTPVSYDLAQGENNVMSYSNDASALGVALALNEARADEVHDAMIRRDWTVYSAVAMTSSEAGRRQCEVVVLGNQVGAGGDLRIGHGALRGAASVDGLKAALRNAGLGFDCCPSSRQQERIVQIFAKSILPGALDASRAIDEADGPRTAKIMAGVLVATVTGRSAAFVSGGERNSHQGAPGCSPVAAIVRVPGEQDG